MMYMQHEGTGKKKMRKASFLRVLF